MLGNPKELNAKLLKGEAGWLLVCEVLETALVCDVVVGAVVLFPAPIPIWLRELANRVDELVDRFRDPVFKLMGVAISIPVRFFSSAAASALI